METTSDRTDTLDAILHTMEHSGQSEAKAIAEVIRDCTENCDDDPREMARAIAVEFKEWAETILNTEEIIVEASYASGYLAGKSAPRGAWSETEIVNAEFCRGFRDGQRDIA